MKPTWLLPEERHRLVLGQHREAARLVEVGRDLGEKLVGRKPDRHRDADVASTRSRSARASGQGHAVQALGAGQVHERLVDRERLDLRGQLEHQLAHLAPDADVFRMSGEMIVACGQSARALNIGIAEWMP
jgi:hypothetical protein